MSTSLGYLYKYRTYNSYSLACLANQTIWLAKPKSFNDPFDCAITLHQSHGIKVRLESGEVGRVKEICV